MGITSTFLGVNMSCSRTQHGDPSGARTPDLWIRTVNHQAKAPPSYRYILVVSANQPQLMPFKNLNSLIDAKNSSYLFIHLWSVLFVQLYDDL